MKNKIKLLLIGCIGLFSLPIALSSPSGQKTPSKILFVQKAQKAILTSSTLTLTQVSGHTLWFTDRPVRKVGIISTATFVEKAWLQGKHSFKQVPPNAAVIDGTTTINSLQEVKADILELKNPVYNTQSQTLTYQVTYINKAKTPHTAETLNDVSIFIDYSAFSGSECAAPGGLHIC